MIYTDDLLEEDRWPTYRTRALGHGVRSSLSLPLTVNGDAVGALNLFSMTPHMFGPDVRARAAAFADQAAAAVGLGMRHARQAELSDQLQQALASRAVIDQAMGIVMAQQRCSADDAFAVLRRISQDTNRRVWDVAADLVTTVTGQPPRPPPFRPPA
jgi:GAF domain-containing protein